jgi:L-serine dehydratase
MSISIFDVAGPVMIGPSSSHTAGAARLGRMAALLAGGEFDSVEFGLYGSFAKTHLGHGTDQALVAGVMGYSESDERLPEAFDLAKSRGLEIRFYETDLRDAHENSVLITFHKKDGTTCQIEGCSIGGGRICIRKIDGFETQMYCDNPSMLVLHRDQRGMLGSITTVMAEHGLNIAVMRCTRRSKGDIACCVLESDQQIDEDIKSELEQIDGVIKVSIVDPSRTRG